MVGGTLVTAGLASAVTDAIAKVLVGAVAHDVTLSATKRRLGYGQHVADAGLTALGQRAKVLGQDSADDSEEGEGLHLGVVERSRKRC